MSPRTTALLALVALALGAFVYLHELGGEVAREAARDEEQRLHPGVEADRIGSISLVSRDGEPARFERRDGQWRLVEPVEDAADARALDAIAFALASLPRAGQVEGAGDLAPFGLDDSARVVRFSVGEGEERRDLGLRIGGPTPVGGNVYVSRLGDDEVAYVERYRLNALEKDLADLRDRRLLDFDTAEVRRLDVAWTDEDGRVALELVRGGAGSSLEVAATAEAPGPDAPEDEDALGGGAGRWRLVAPLSTPADGETVRDLLSDLAFLQASGFVDAPDAQMRAALERPAFEVAIGLADREAPLRLVVGDEVAGRRLVETSEGRLRTIAPERLEDLPRSLAAYRDRTLARFDVAAAGRVVLELASASSADGARGGADPLRVVAELGSAGWARTAGEPPLDPDRFSDLVRDLAGLRAADVLADGLGDAERAGLGLAPPRVAIRVEARDAPADAPALAEIALGAAAGEDRGPLAMRADGATVYVLPAQAALDLPRSREDFEARFLVDPSAERDAEELEAVEEMPDVEGGFPVDPLEGIDLD